MENNKKYSIEDESIIQEKGLSEKDVFMIVNEWYTNGMYPYILQNEDGSDLEEICEMFIYNEVII